MKRNITPLIIGNWKMNPQTIEKAEALFADIKKSTKKDTAVEIVVAAPFVFIAALQRASKNSRIKLAAQNVFKEPLGAYTGEISIPMLKSLGATHVILGHSERRALGESNEKIHESILAVLKSGLTAVVCVGEKARDAQGDYFSFVEAQIKSAIASIPNSHLSRLVIAYEPIWAIGTSKHATAEDVQEMKLFIQKNIADHFGRSAVPKVRILYGGSVNTDNAKELLETGRPDGFLVGGASLKASEFAEIIHISTAYGKV